MSTNVPESEIKKLKVAHYKCLKDFAFSVRYLYKKKHGRKYILGRHHEIICSVLEKVLRGELTRVIFNLAPRYGKTELAVKHFIAHGLALNAAAKFIHLTYAAKLALDNSEEAKDIVQSDDYQLLFPHVQIKKDSKAKSLFPLRDLSQSFCRNTSYYPKRRGRT